MSHEDLNMIIILLNGLQNNDNTIRRESEKRLEIMKEKNISGLIFILSNVLISNKLFHNHQVLIRKILKP